MATKKPPPDDPAQSARFVETAKAAGGDARAFAAAIGVILPGDKKRKRKKRPQS